MLFSGYLNDSKSGTAGEKVEQVQIVGAINTIQTPSDAKHQRTNLRSCKLGPVRTVAVDGHLWPTEAPTNVMILGPVFFISKTPEPPSIPLADLDH